MTSVLARQGSQFGPLCSFSSERGRSWRTFLGGLSACSKPVCAPALIWGPREPKRTGLEPWGQLPLPPYPLPVYLARAYPKPVLRLPLWARVKAFARTFFLKKIDFLAFAKNFANRLTTVIIIVVSVGCTFPLPTPRCVFTPKDI